MKKSAIVLISLVLTGLLGLAQTPYTIIKFDSTIRNVVDAVKLNESEFIIVGNSKYVQGQPNNIFIAQMNTDGDIIWKKEHNGYMQWYSSICAKTDGNYYIAMSDTTYAAKLLETSSRGDSLWSFTSTEPELNNKCFGIIKEFPDGKLILSEAIYSNSVLISVTESRYYILNDDCTINLMFNTQNDEIFDIEIVSNTEFIAAERSWKYGINKYNINGQVQNYDSCAEFSDSECVMWELYNTSENQFYATGRYSEYPDKYGLISKIDENGQIEYCSIDTSLSYFLGLIQTNDDHLIYYGMRGEDKLIIGEMTSSGTFIPKIEIDNVYDFWGSTNSFISGNYIYIFIEVFDETTSPSIIKIPIDSIVSSIETINYGSIKTYPNPAKDYVVFEFSVPGPEFSRRDAYGKVRESSIRLTNIFGQQVALLPVKSEKTVWDTRTVNPGLYFFAIDGEETYITGKIVISK